MTTEHPCRVSAKAVAEPAGPPPSTATSTFFFKGHVLPYYAFRSVSTYLEPFLTTKPSRCHFLTISMGLLTNLRIHRTCGPPLMGKTSSGRCAGHQASSPSCAQSSKSACQGTAICLVTSPAFRRVWESRNGSVYLYLSRRSQLASMPG